jgi:ketosteroid isomerase-like protein
VEPPVAASSQQIYERYVWATAMTRNADAVAELFTDDGVIEAPLLAADRLFPARMQGREEIRDHPGGDARRHGEKLAAYYVRAANPGRTVNPQASRYVLHNTVDPDVFIVEIDAVFDGPEPGTNTTMSLVQIFRTRDGKIALMRDYFASDEVE